MKSLPRSAAAVVAVLLVLAPALSGEVFTYKYQAGQKYRVVSEVFQDILVNGRFRQQGNQLNRILVTVEKVEGGRGWHTVDYQNSLESRRPGEVYQYDRTYRAEFWRDAVGMYAIDPKYFVPTVRNVPVFPVRDLKPGESWSGQGSEVHDLRQSFGVPDAFEFTFPVNYRYEGKAEWNGATYDLISIDYNIFFRSRKSWPQAVYPLQISGYSHQKLWWDNQAGRPVHYEEEYLIQLNLSDGNVVAYEGTAQSRVEDIVPFDIGHEAGELRRKIDELAIPDVAVREDPEGITLSLENIQFAPDSAELLASEKSKLERLGQLLAAYPDRDLLVSGHTAQAGNAAGRKPLSEARARAVGQFLVDLGVRSADRLMFQGLGDTQPVAGNDTEEGRARNRRVEITILTH